jgi:hypothetical protein
MPSSTTGRPHKPEEKKRQQIVFSLYREDIQYLDLLTDNRSEFIRHCIMQSWVEKQDEEVTLSVTMPKRLIRELFGLVKPSLSPSQVTLAQALMEDLLAGNKRK